ncbi:MAG: SDR family oxidoreductase [Pseudomonadota bacterium]
MSFSIAGKTAIVTGAANGIGLAIARHFVEEGANVMFVDMDDAALTAQIGDKVGEIGPIRMFNGDLRQKLTIANLLSATIDAFERIDILVNAARQVMPGDAMNPDDKAIETALQQNVLAGLRLSQMIAKRMIKQASEAGDDSGQAGSIINLSSITPRRTHPDLLAFSVSAAALDQATRSLALALAPRRVRVNAVAFGSVMSASLKRSLKEDEGLRESVLSVTPMGRIAKSSELAAAVQFLASEASAFVTGQILTVDGGRTLLDPVAGVAH